MHRYYQPVTPANNKLLKRKWDQKLFVQHRQNVLFAKPVIDNRPPSTFMHLYLKLKKLKMEEERLAIVERDNRILLEKISYTMRTQGRIDMDNQYEQKSLNTTRRQRELLRVTHENQAILKRLSSKEPYYRHLEWEDQWRKQQKQMRHMSKYPHEWRIVNKPRGCSSQPDESQSAVDGRERLYLPTLNHYGRKSVSSAP